MRLRIAIREQLAALVLFLVLFGLAAVSIPTWIFVNQFTVGVQSNGLSLTASLKASRIASEIKLIQTSCRSISTRLLLQQAFTTFYNGNGSGSDNWLDAREDLESALSAAGSSYLLQARLYSRNTTGDGRGLVNVTGVGLSQYPPIRLPYAAPNGSLVALGDPDHGYPPTLFPNISYHDLGRLHSQYPTEAFSALVFPNLSLGNGSNGGGLLLGPLVINESFALVSCTTPVRMVLNQEYTLGYMTIVASAASLISVERSEEGLGRTGMVLLVGSTNPWNHFDASLSASNETYTPDRAVFGASTVQFVLPPRDPTGQTTDRHSLHDYTTAEYDAGFTLEQYPAALDLLSRHTATINNASSLLSTRNEQGGRVAVGLARPQTSLVTWAVIVEMDEAEASAPVRTLRRILLACVFGTVALIMLVVIPCAHFSVLPIRRLTAATENSVDPVADSQSPGRHEKDSGSDRTGSTWPEKGFLSMIRGRMRRRKTAARTRAHGGADSRRRTFRIPPRVRDRKHVITDELTELTDTFNQMTGELLAQYSSLDARVAERTRELETSKKAAEAANESKTLFIANISHELKTPLNGIMGMCAVCMEEEDPARIKHSLRTLYKSGDLLLHLLEDLLSFSKNQMGQQIRLEEREFRLGDVRHQILSIFDKQIREKRIAFAVSLGEEEDGETAGLKNMCLWGDQHRILQVLINLVSNSLKFTPAGGRVQLRIRRLGEVAEEGGEGEEPRPADPRATHTRVRKRDHSSSSSSSRPRPRPRSRSATPPPSHARSHWFEFEVNDTGPGIAEHMQQKIFEPFVQGDLGLSKKYGGTGLGLSICSQLAGIMGGRIGLRSTVGVGTTFSMLIPLKYVRDRTSSTASSSVHSRPASTASIDGDNTTQPSPASQLDQQPRLVGLRQPFFATKALPSAAAARHVRVLVADDNNTNIEVVSRMLRLEAVSDVTVAKDGQEAYDVVRANMAAKQPSFDLILMDVQMPNLDGLASTRLIREMGYQAPIVALTAFSEESNMRECMESGMDEFLSKPIRRPALKRVLRKFATIPEEPDTAAGGAS